MNFLISANTDIGTTKQTNQDSLAVKILNTVQGRMVFAVLCDGMGGLANGEIASASLVYAFESWCSQELPKLCKAPLEDNVIRNQWEKIIDEMNQKIKVYGLKQGVRMGTTAVVMLLTDQRYYIMNVGDSRIYELGDQLSQLTTDQTVVGREVALGHITEVEAKVDERRNVLLQCVGASDTVYPEMIFGSPKANTVYILCSDGFRHEISSEEIASQFDPHLLMDNNTMSQRAAELIEENKRRGERDNISVALVRTF